MLEGDQRWAEAYPIATIRKGARNVPMGLASEYLPPPGESYGNRLFPGLEKGFRFIVLRGVAGTAGRKEGVCFLRNNQAIPVLTAKAYNLITQGKHQLAGRIECFSQVDFRLRNPQGASSFMMAFRWRGGAIETRFPMFRGQLSRNARRK
ncbi:hypothetical protein K3X48_07955 [Aliiroseovarius crassostreae]|uniref:Uncharacterized protein n=1 Tax=Aliiroseovarius crassostreae TaxID=154981 RepID=A0A9Q9H9J2_9RHOB|nr:hypothetical protein [Aliiroseovarius crassostreae]UWP94197.1 hypothetical protein K3X48_07955 [Aliiroseovarius crassostreae]